MNKAKHTPGPWHYTQGNAQNPHNAEVRGGFRGALIHLSIAMDERDFANARLIAAAPDLLKALNELLEQIECLGGIEYSKDLEPYKAEACWDNAVSRAHSVIARATGK